MSDEGETKTSMNLASRPKSRRDKWGRQAEFVLSCIGYSVGLGAVWRFPYLCMRNGGGAFLIPYFTFLFLCGIPLFFMELCLGQFSGSSPLSLWQICPLLQGVGWGMLVVSSFLCIYYTAIMAWVLYYFIMSLGKTVPWETCGNAWNTPNCMVLGQQVQTNNTCFGLSNDTATYVESNISLVNTNYTLNSTVKMVSAAEEFWNYKVLDISDGIEHLGTIKWDLALSFLVTWVMIFLCLCKGIKSSGKVAYVTATLPYVLLTVLVIRGATLPGALKGVKFYVVPKWEKLTELKVWTDACLQIFYSLGPAWGGLITMSSYNKFHNNCMKDALVICFTCALSSFYGGFAVFSILGYMSHATGLPIEEVVAQGPGLAFVAYPEAIAKLPVSPMWGICFFVTLWTLGVDSHFGTLETILSGLTDEYPKYLRKRKIYFTLAVCCVMFLLGLPLVTKGGVYVFQLIDWYSGAFSAMVIAFMECVAVSYIYGIGRFYKDIAMMLQFQPSPVWMVFWCAISPLLLLFMLVVSAYRMVPPTYGDYVFPSYSIVLGWMMAMASIIPIPAVACYKLATATGSLKERLCLLLSPQDSWGPAASEYSLAYKAATQGQTWKDRLQFRQLWSTYHWNLKPQSDELCNNHTAAPETIGLTEKSIEDPPPYDEV